MIYQTPGSRVAAEDNDSYRSTQQAIPPVRDCDRPVPGFPSSEVSAALVAGVGVRAWAGRGVCGRRGGMGGRVGRSWGEGLQEGRGSWIGGDREAGERAGREREGERCGRAGGRVRAARKAGGETGKDEGD